MPRRLTRSRGKKLQKNKLHKKDRTSSGHAMKKTLVERYSTNFCVSLMNVRANLFLHYNCLQLAFIA